MSAPLQRRTVIFVVRIWREYLAQDPPCWRGEVECVESGRRICFQSVGEMADHLHSQALASPEAPEEGEQPGARPD